MRVLVQRVSRASVSAEEREVGSIGPGLVLFVGIRQTDAPAAVEFCADKCADLRVFDDAEGRLNRSVRDVEGEILAISQFTLYGETRKGRRPSFSHAATPELARPLYEAFIERLEERGLRVARGLFGAHMSVEMHHDGPVTLLVEFPDHSEVPHGPP